MLAAIKKVLTGEVIRRLDTGANDGHTTMSLRLKRNRKSGEHYVVLVERSAGNYQYAAFSKQEFGQFAESVSAIQDLLRQH